MSVVTFKDFQKLDIRIGKILDCKLPHAKVVRLLAVLGLSPLSSLARVLTSSHAKSWGRLPDPSPVILI